ncbi:MAG: hypothetical protein H8D23_17635 [Candidatus Brocadiales bacterium]|nr:hypothetical protein [Candidatus Brocadiales bacterium]
MCVVCGEHCVEDDPTLDHRLEVNTCPKLRGVPRKDRALERKKAKRRSEEEGDVRWENL